MKYMMRVSYIDVLGTIWWPTGALCSMRKGLSSYDISNMRDEDGEITRESIDQWVCLNSGDFQAIVDWRGSIEDGDETLDFDWERPGSEDDYLNTLPEEN